MKSILGIESLEFGCIFPEIFRNLFLDHKWGFDRILEINALNFQNNYVECFKISAHIASDYCIVFCV